MFRFNQKALVLLGFSLFVAILLIRILKDKQEGDPLSASVQPVVVEEVQTPPIRETDETTIDSTQPDHQGNEHELWNQMLQVAAESSSTPTKLTPEDYEVLKELPPGCIKDLPEIMMNLPTDSDNRDSQGGGFQSAGINVDATGSPEESSGNVMPASYQDESPYALNQPATLESLANSLPDPGANLPQDYHNGPIGTSDMSLINPHAGAAPLSTKIDLPPGVDPHAEVFANTPYPSATECAQCHEQIFEEWSSSSHAYASISPMFHRFEDTINKLAQGTIGYFCLRCHAPVATTMGLRRDQAIWDGPRVFREGVTCVACHRVKSAYTKSNGERRIEPGSIYDPVYGGSGDGSGVGVARKYKEYFKVKTDPYDKRPGQAMHNRSIVFEELSKSDYCMSCHQVAVQPGIKLEVVWDQYRASPAYREGTTCQDCHMGLVPGKNAGYSYGPAAVVDNKVVNPERKHSNHVFFGPGYSVAHPGIFPHNRKADRWTVNQWIEFQWRDGWGTDEFEDAVANGTIQAWFPPAWQEVDDRYDAREIIEENLKKLAYKKDIRRQVMENGSKIDGPFFGCDPKAGQPLRFNYVVSNISNGHNMPSGSLGAQPQLWLNVVLIGPDGSHIWESGDLDSWGDLRDIHSSDVVQRKVPLDSQLFNLQTKFLTTNAKGTDREMFLPVNVDFDQLPFIRPDTRPATVLNHPGFIRMEGHSIPALGSRKAKYMVPGSLITTPGTYRLSVRLRSRAEPIYFMRFVGATPEMIRMMNEWIVDIHPYSVVFEVK